MFVCPFVFLLFICSAKYAKYAERAVPLIWPPTRVMGLSWIYLVPCFDSFCQRNFGLPKICWCHIKDEHVILSVRLQVQLACGANFTKLRRESGKINFYLGGKINFVSILLISLWHTVLGFTKRCNEKKSRQNHPILSRWILLLCNKMNQK